jgi:peptide/nickel transport system permease protein
VLRWIPAAAIAALATLGPFFTGPAEAPSLAPSAAQLLPPGTRVEEVELAGGGLLRALDVEVAPEAVRIRSRDGWREIRGVETRGPVRSRKLWLGSDPQGRDLAARTVGGARASLTIGLLAAAIAVVVGTAVGLGTALSGSLVGSALSVVTDGALGLPRILLLLILGVVLRGSTAGVALAIGLASWMEVSRLVAGDARSIRALPYVSSGRASGAGAVRLAFRHVLPNVAPIVAVAVPLVTSEAILLESTLSYLGVGGDPGAASWGRMIADGQRLLPSGWALVVFPGILLVLSAVALARIAVFDTLRVPILESRTSRTGPASTGITKLEEPPWPRQPSPPKT